MPSQLTNRSKLRITLVVALSVFVQNIWELLVFSTACLKRAAIMELLHHLINFLQFRTENLFLFKYNPGLLRYFLMTGQVYNSLSDLKVEVEFMSNLIEVIHVMQSVTMGNGWKSSCVKMNVRCHLIFLDLTSISLKTWTLFQDLI